MQRSMRWITCLALVAALAACSSEDEEEGEDLPEVDCSGDVPTYSEVTAFSEVCTDCHSTTKTGDARNDAPEDINFDNYTVAKANAEFAAEEVFEGEMPPEGSGATLTEAQKQDLYTWALCDTPE